jgi:hypothetical protein
MTNLQAGQIFASRAGACPSGAPYYVHPWLHPQILDLPEKELSNDKHHSLLCPNTSEDKKVSAHDLLPYYKNMTIINDDHHE